MKRLDITRRAGRNLRYAKGRTLLTSLAIAVGAFTLTMALAAGEGARQYADKLLSSNVSKQSILVFKDKGARQGTDSAGGLTEYSDSTGTAYGATIKMMTQQDIEKLSKESDIESVQPFYSLSAKYVQLAGSDKKYVTQLDSYDPNRQYTLAAGSVPGNGQDLAPGEATVPEGFAKALNTTTQKLIGTKVRLTLIQPQGKIDQATIERLITSGNITELQTLSQPQMIEKTVTVRAVVSKGMLIGSGSASSGITIDGQTAREVAEISIKNTDNYQKYYSLIVKVKSAVNPQHVKTILERQGYAAETAKDLANVLFTIVNILQGIVVFFGILALLASVFGIINTQYISVLERTSQIGLMKALGMRSRDVAKLFRYEAAWIGLIGGVLGSGVAWLVGTAMNPWLSKTLALGNGNQLLIFIWWQIVLLVVVLVAIAVVAGWFPARKAAKLDPIEALRTE